MPLTIIEFLSSKPGDSTRDLYIDVCTCCHSFTFATRNTLKDIVSKQFVTTSSPNLIPQIRKKIAYSRRFYTHIDGNFQEKDFLCRKRSLKIAAAEKREKGREGRP